MVRWGDFEVDLSTPLGEGAMGTVYRGMQVSLRRPVAVKVVSPGLTVDRAILGRFEQEALAMARLSHPNVIQIYGASQQDDRPWFAMEFVDGESLAAYLERVGPVPPDEVARIGIQIARGIGAALEQGIVHRDLKPSNVLRLPDGTIKVMDFGLAKLITAAGQTTVQGTVLGTPLYMSPEQAMGRAVDGRSDLYSLGAILFELASGRPPFQGESITSIIYLHVHEAPAMLSRIAAGVPKPLAHVVARCLEKDSRRRYQSPAEVAAALEEFLANPRGSGNWIQADRLVFALASVAALGLSIYAWTSSHGPDDSTPPEPSTAPLVEAPSPPAGSVGESPSQPSGPVSESPVPEPPSPAEPPPVDPFEQAKAEGEEHLRAGRMAEAAASLRAALALREDGALREAYVGALEALAPEGMVLVRHATYIQGADGESGPPHQVTVSDFYLDRTEVTNAQYARFLADIEASGDHSRCHPTEPAGKSHVPRFRDVPTLQHPSHPVVGVDWWDAWAFAAWAGKRLPTEAEWELAARGAEGRLYPWGNAWEPRNLNSQGAADGAESLALVGSYPSGATSLRIQDLAGNVSEWCSDWWAAYPASEDVLVDPAGPLSGTHRVVRGGSCAHKDEASFQGASRAQKEDPSARITALGFRCAKGIE